MNAGGQIILPSALRRLGIEASTRLELSEAPDGIRLRVAREEPRAEISRLDGLFTAPTRGRPRSLDAFDPTSLLARKRRCP